MSEGSTWCSFAAHVVQKEECILARTSSGRKRAVTVLIYKHRHGEDVSVHKTVDGAEARVYGYMKLWMTEVEESKRAAIKKAIRYRRLREACNLWSEAFGWGGHAEEFIIYENMVVYA